MKKIKLTFFVLTLVFSLKCYAQTSGCWNPTNLNTVTTKWNAPQTSNTQNWNWTLPGLVHPVYLQNNLSAPSIFIELPYFCSKILSCNNGNTFQYEVLKAVGIAQDIDPENGWELVVKDFGTPNPPNQSTGGRSVPNPIFILYNRYTGRMKTYVAIIGQKTANSAHLQISFTQNNILNSLFAHATPVSKTLLEFEPTNLFKSLNDYSLLNLPDDYQWMVSEIQTNYDPCVCTGNLNNNISSIQVRPFLIDASNIDAVIEGTITQNTQNLLSNGAVNTEGDGKTSFLDMTKNAAEAAIKGYSDFGNYKVQLNKLLDDKNNAYKNKLISEWFNDYVKKNPQYQGTSGLVAKENLWNALGRTDDEFKRSIGIEGIDEYQTNSEFVLLKSIASYVPYVGSAIGLIDLFVNGGKKQDPPKPSPPMVFNVSLRLTGQIIKENGLSPTFFQAPGFNGTPNDLTPIYNNILGVFNILKPPPVKALGIKPSIVPVDTYFGNAEDNTIDENITEANMTNFNQFQQAFSTAFQTPMFKQYQLKENVKYILNKAANLEVEMIDACFVIEYSKLPNRPNPSLWVDNNFVNDYSDNYSLPYYSDIFNPTLTIQDRIDKIEKTGLELEFISKSTDLIRFRTQYVPLTCLKNQTFNLFAGRAPKVYVKMLIKFKRIGDVNSESITEIVTYDISSSFVSPELTVLECQIPIAITVFLENYSNTPSPIRAAGTFAYFQYHKSTLQSELTCFPNRYPAEVNSYYSTDLPSLNVSLRNSILIFEDNSIIAPNTFLKAKKMVFGKNIVVNNNVELVSGSDIIIQEESTINPNSVLRIENSGSLLTWNCPDVSISTLQATDDEISEICNNLIYKTKAGIGKTNEETFKEKPLKKPLKFKLFPNPAKNIVSVIINGEDEIADVNLSILDLTGKVVLNNLIFNQIKNGTEINIDVSSLANGVYFINLNDDKETKSVKKLIIAQ